MKLCFLFIVVVVLWTKHGETKRTKGENGAKKRNKIVRKQHIPDADYANTKKQYIDNYGGGSLGNIGYETETIQNDAGYGGAELSAQAGVGNTLQGAGLSLDSGLSQDGSDVMSTLKGGNEFDPISNDLVDSSESTEGRQLQNGNGFGQGGGAGGDAMFTVPSTGDNSLSTSAGAGGGFIDSMSAGLGGGSVGGGAVQDAGLAGVLGGAGTGGGSIGGDTGAENMAALSDGMGANLGGAGGSIGGLSAGLGGGGGGSIDGGDIGGGIGGGSIGGGSIGGGSIGGGSIGGGSIGGGSIGGGSIGGGSIGGGGIGGGSIGGGGIGGGSIGGSSFGGGSIGGGSIGGGVEGGLGEIGGGFGGGGGLSAVDLGGMDGGALGSLAGLGGTNDASIDGGMGLGGLSSHLSGGSKQLGMDDLGGLGDSLGSQMDLAGFGGSGPGLHGAGHMSGLATASQSPEDSQLSDAVGETPSAMHPGLTSILPGKTVHAHVSDKPSSTRPAVTGPAMTAALQVQMEAQKQHQARLQALKLKLKKLREKLEQLQSSSKKHETLSASQEEDDAELDTLNDLKKATQDAIKELNTDYLHVKKHESVVATKHETLGTKLKTVDFTAKETGDTLEELLKLLDPELQDKKRGNVDGKKRNNTRLDDEAENKLTSLTKKAEEEVDKLATQNSKEKPENVSGGNSSAMKAVEKAPAPWKGVATRKSKLKTTLLSLGETSSTHDKKKIRVPSRKSKLKTASLKLGVPSRKSKLKTASLKLGKTTNSAQEKKKLKYTRVGCWRDDPSRVVPSLENTSSLLESGYRVRDNSIKKCARVAKEQGFDGFAIENGGQCFSGQNLLKRYKMYGKSNDCAKDGRGGDYAMDVYKFAN